MDKNTPWQLLMFKKSLKKQQKIATLSKHFSNDSDKKCLLITCGDNNGAMNYQIKSWGGEWQWAELEDHNIEEIESLIGEHVTFVEPPYESLPFPDNCFDCIITIDCHEHMSDPSKFNHELYRISKPGGKVVVTVPNGNERKLAVRIKHLVGMSKHEYGHHVVGYDIPVLRSMLENAGLVFKSSSSYSKFFTEMIELCINFLYVKVLAKKNSTPVEEGVIAPTSKEQLQSISKTYKLYSKIYPMLYLISILDYLLYFTRGYAVVVETRKTD